MTKDRVRIISDNDYGGDPDGLVQLAHHLLRASVAYLFRSLHQCAEDMQGYGLPMGETFILGDSPLVLLSALFSSFSPSPSSSVWIERPRFELLESGHYDSTTGGPNVRIFTRLDVRLLVEDLYARLAIHHAVESGQAE